MRMMGSESDLQEAPLVNLRIATLQVRRPTLAQTITPSPFPPSPRRLIAASPPF